MATVKLDPAKGVQIPNLSTSERNAISSPETGALIWNTTTSAINQYNGSAWSAVDTSTDNTKLPLAGGTMTGDLDLGDNVKANFGASADLKIYHENSNNNSFIHESGAGSLYIRATSLIFKSGVDNDDYIKCTENGDIKLYYSNAQKLATTATGINVTGGVVSDAITSESAVGTNIVAKSTNGNGGYYNYQGLASNGTQTFGVNHNGTIFTTSGLAVGGTGAANTLDDYEEGNYTVTITMGTGTAAVASSANTLSYTKVGRLVTIGGQFRVGSVSSPDGEFQISLPFACETNTSGTSNHYHVGTYRTYLIDTPNDGTHPVIYSNPGSAVATLQWSRDQASGTNERATANGYFMIGLTYMAA